MPYLSVVDSRQSRTNVTLGLSEHTVHTACSEGQMSVLCKYATLVSCQSSETLISWNDGIPIENLGYPDSADPRNVKKVVKMSENPC